MVELISNPRSIQIPELEDQLALQLFTYDLNAFCRSIKNDMDKVIELFVVQYATSRFVMNDMQALSFWVGKEAKPAWNENYGF